MSSPEDDDLKTILDSLAKAWKKKAEAEDAPAADDEDSQLANTRINTAKAIREECAAELLTVVKIYLG